jgi:hypothetical protein
VQARERACQLVGRHGERDGLAVDGVGPAEALQQPQVLGERAAEAPTDIQTSPMPVRWVTTNS